MTVNKIFCNTLQYVFNFLPKQLSKHLHKTHIKTIPKTEMFYILLQSDREKVNQKIKCQILVSKFPYKMNPYTKQKF